MLPRSDIDLADAQRLAEEANGAPSLEEVYELRTEWSQLGRDLQGLEWKSRRGPAAVAWSEAGRALGRSWAQRRCLR